MQEEPKKKRRKDKKGKGKQREQREQPVDQTEQDDEVDVGMTAVERGKKVKRAMDEYKALDHEDMVSLASLSVMYLSYSARSRFVHRATSACSAVALALSCLKNLLQPLATQLIR